MNKFILFLIVLTFSVFAQPTLTSNDFANQFAVEQIDNLPNDFSLGQNYPNPFNPSTTITFSIPEASYVSLKIFSSLGEEIETLVSEDWNAEGLTSGISAKGGYASGVYFYKLQTDNFVQTKKMMLIK